MGSVLSGAFIDTDDLPGCVEVDGVTDCSYGNEGWGWGLVQVLSIMTVYGLILFNASNMLSDGSELLLLVPSISGIVGSVVLPILGAVPDGAIMLFSGLGPDAQEQLTVGVGTLAGSTIMLLTIPWGLSIFMGAVPLDANGTAAYSRRKEKGTDWKVMGVTPDSTIRSNAYIMVGTALIYLVIQGPAFEFATEPEYLDEKADVAAKEEHWYAFAGLLISIGAFVGYLILMVKQSGMSDVDYLINHAALKALEGSEHTITLSGIIGPIIAEAVERQANVPDGDYVSSEFSIERGAKETLSALLKPQFHKYDANRDGKLQVSELQALLADVGERLTHDEAKHWMHKLDPDQSGEIDQHEFIDMMLSYMKEKVEEISYREVSTRSREAPADAADDDDDDDDEEDDMPEDIQHLTPAEQQRKIKQRAAVLCGVGTVLVVVFSDPMVDVMSNLGKRIGVPPFYIAFVLAPLASNASELIASLLYAQKKSKKTITVSLSALEGAACMNNTFCLAIFMALIYFKSLVWKFSAETCAILLVQLLVAGIALLPTQKTSHALFVLALYPLSIVFVCAVEAAGFD